MFLFIKQVLTQKNYGSQIYVILVFLIGSFIFDTHHATSSVLMTDFTFPDPAKTDKMDQAIK